MTAPDDVRGYVEERLDLPYVESCALAVAATLLVSAPIECNYQPGDGTRYGLVFVPLLGLRRVPGRVAPIQGSEPVEWDAYAVVGLRYERGACLVVWADHGVLLAQFARRMNLHWTAAAAAFDTTEASGHALALLLERIADSFGPPR